MIGEVTERECCPMSRGASIPVPAASAEERHFIVGQDLHGWWLAVEMHNRGGGLFKSREAALHFVDAETDHRRGACEFATAPLHLTF